MQNIQEAKSAPANRAEKRRGKSKKTDPFIEFDRARYMFVRTAAGLTLWNRSLSMLGNGYRPSVVALHLYQHYGVRIKASKLDITSECDQEAVAYFECLVVPSDAIAPVPSIFDDHWGEA